MKQLKDYRFGIGPMSKNIVDACIDFVEKYDVRMMFIPSRRQIDFAGGYVGWDTESFAKYVKSRTDRIPIMRDHGGPGQGDRMDDGLYSLRQDCLYFDMVHLDPWKMAEDLGDGFFQTRNLLLWCSSFCSVIQYEIGTEQSIFKYDHIHLNDFIKFISRWSGVDEVRYAVIQTGTSLCGNENTGTYNPDRLDAMVAICKRHGLLAKVHNGDYLPIDLIREMFRRGVDAINIAPEFGQIETQTYLREMDTNLLDAFYDICYDSGRWRKWIDDPTDKIKLINASGHYVLSNPDFLARIKAKVRPDIDTVIKANVTKKLEELYGATQSI